MAAARVIGEWIALNNTERPHSTLAGATEPLAANYLYTNGNRLTVAASSGEG